jgi:hypothetical protein
MLRWTARPGQQTDSLDVPSCLRVCVRPIASVVSEPLELGNVTGGCTWNNQNTADAGAHATLNLLSVASSIFLS